ncbi:MAG: cell wall-binding repeat-containing protein, partial [Finegoldia magna]|nr:cell wall-binding repeat-containing protein [Finegoldia magna]
NGRTYADALIASYLSKKENAPIVLIDKENVPVSVKEYLRENKIKDSIILGGDSSIANVK